MKGFGGKTRLKLSKSDSYQNNQRLLRHEYECEERNKLDKEDGNAGRTKSMIETPRGSWASRSVQLGTRHLFEENLYLLILTFLF